jgi:tRNA-splicing ligase RtcB
VKKQDFVNVGVTGEYIPQAMEAVKSAGKAGRFKGIAARKLVKDVAQNPNQFVNDEHFGSLARLMLQPKEEPLPLPDPIGFTKWGKDIDEASIKQMESACRVPVASAAALMPDAHLGYGLPIGGVLGTENAVIPYAVGVDIACRMKLTVIDTPVKELEKELRSGFRRGDRLSEAITAGTRFGVGAEWKQKQHHNVMDKDWNITPVTKAMKDRAWSQLGTSGSGNHFVEIGVLTLAAPEMGLETGTYLAILSHSGSRGAGANVCSYYKDVAISKLDKRYQEHFKHLAWLSLDSEAGQEYWAAMNLMGDYAAANHAVIHNNIVSILGAQVLAGVENHHNFAWKEEHNGKELIVHRKGATPAGAGVLGVIPGSMADPCFVVRGKGKPESLNSASHGAGRRMSRNEAKKQFNWNQWKSVLAQRGVRLLSAGLDEVPGAYKPILEVMAAQTDLVDIIARFDPKIVKMSDDGRSED